MASAAAPSGCAAPVESQETDSIHACLFTLREERCGIPDEQASRPALLSVCG